MRAVLIEHVFLDGFPDVEDFPAAEWTKVVNTLNEDGIL